MIALHCAKCRATLGAITRLFSLNRDTESTREVDSGAAVETVVHYSDGLSTFCEKCGEDAALKTLRGLGYTPLRAQPDPPTPLCCRCQGRFVEEDRPHTVYAVTHELIDGNGGIEVLDYLWRAPVCGDCEPVSAAHAADAISVVAA